MKKSILSIHLQWYWHPHLQICTPTLSPSRDRVLSLSFSTGHGKYWSYCPLIGILLGGTPAPWTNSTRKGTDPSKRGFYFCTKNFCRYSPKLNKTCLIVSTTTGLEYPCMRKISCRSLNLIYCITCTRCNIQYVAQTLLRIMDYFKAHFYSIEKPDPFQVFTRHFSHPSHNGILDVTISALVYIHKAPRSPASYMHFMLC